MKWLLRAALFAFVLCGVMVLLSRCVVANAAGGRMTNDVDQVPKTYTAIVLGCRVIDGQVGNCLEERLTAALELYKAGKVQRLLMSGDHGHTNYDEVNAMRNWLIARGVPGEDIFLDHAGFDTWDTMVRAKKVFQVGDAVIVTQAFHLPRALYLARSAGLGATGFISDPPQGSVCKGEWFREIFARVKAVLNVWLDARPKFLGPIIPITGSPAASLDHGSELGNR